jgi:hypothetical protein
MKSLISVTPREFKRHFCEVMEMCTDICMTTNQEIVITIPTSRKSNTHAEIAKLVPVEGGIKYEYNRELMDKHGINASNPKAAKIEAIIAEAFEKSRLAEYGRKNKEAVECMQKAMALAVEELVKMM